MMMACPCQRVYADRSRARYNHSSCCNGATLTVGMNAAPCRGGSRAREEWCSSSWRCCRQPRCSVPGSSARHTRAVPFLSTSNGLNFNSTFTAYKPWTPAPHGAEMPERRSLHLSQGAAGTQSDDGLMCLSPCHLRTSLPGYIAHPSWLKEALEYWWPCGEHGRAQDGQKGSDLIQSIPLPCSQSLSLELKDTKAVHEAGQASHASCTRQRRQKAHAGEASVPDDRRVWIARTRLREGSERRWSSSGRSAPERSHSSCLECRLAR